MPRSYHPGQRVNTRSLIDLPDLQELSLDELAELPNEARQAILMKADEEFRRQQKEAKKQG
jgi:hypothetical protein